MLRTFTLLVLGLLIGRAAYMAMRPAVEEETDKTVTLELSVWGMPFENYLYTDVYIPEFERQNPNIKVKFSHFEDYANRILLSHAGGIPPDVIRMNIDFSQGWIRKGVNMPLDRFIDGPDGIDRKDFIPVTWEGITWDGKTWGVPQDINMLGLFYNKDILDKYGVEYPDATWTWDDLKEAAERLTIDENKDGRPEIIGLELPWNLGGLRPLVFQQGGRFWNEDKTISQFDTPETVNAARFLKSLMKRYTLTRSNSTRGGLGQDKFFEQGRVALFVDGSWRSPSLKKNAPKLNFGVAPLPRQKYGGTTGSSCYWAISSRCRHPEAAWKLTKFLSSQDALAKYWQTLWVAPPARWSVLRSRAFEEISGIPPDVVPGVEPEEWDEKCAWIRDVLENDWAYVEESGPYSDLMRTHIGSALDKVLLDDADPVEQFRKANKATNEQIQDILRLEAPSK